MLFIVCAGLGVTACDQGAPEIAGETPRQVIRLEADQVARLADSIRQTVPARLADGFELALWAPEQLLADPIALDIDDRGRALITRTFRQDNSEFDIRGYPHWMIESISWETVEDRRAFLRREFAPARSDSNDWLEDLNNDGVHDWQDLAVEKEQVYRIEDSDGDGRADFSQLYIEDFNSEVTDVAGAVLAYEDDVYLGVGPDMWRLQDTDGDGVADRQESISHGYGIHIGFSGHGMSGLTVGPDGRIYWSIGDIGFNGVGPDGTEWTYPNQGVLVRSNPDGSDFEVYAAGLRNTHEFEFDAYGNIISVDNDGDHPGEHERLVYIVNGSDSGWRANWQYGKYVDPKNNTYKVWMDEELFKPRFEGQAAYITPPVAAYHSGPAGMAYNPGLALSEAWQDHFFVAEFTGSPARSRVWAFRLRPKGATFELESEQEVVGGILATGLDIGPDGALYFADWIDGWGTKDQGRIWKLDVAGEAASPERAEVAALVGDDFEGRSEEELAGWLGHADMRIRQKAQFELARREATDVLLAAAHGTDLMARIHGLWGLWQLVRHDIEDGTVLAEFLGDQDAEIRAQAAKIIGDVRYAGAADALLPLLEDASARVRFFAAEALGRIEHGPAVEPILAMLEANDDEDAFLRHAGALALVRIGDAEPIVALSDHPSRALRIAAVVALRRMRHPGVVRFLEDEDLYIVTEAARAINDDASIEAALGDLARVLEREGLTGEPLLRRAINANARLGTEEAAARLAAYAASESAPEAMRIEALAALGVWANPSVLDRVDGRYRGAFERDSTMAGAAIASHVESLLNHPNPALRVATADMVARLAYAPAAGLLFDRVRGDADPAARRAALQALAAIDGDRLGEAVRLALEDADQDVRMTALGLVPTLDLSDQEVVDLLASVVGTRSIVEQQEALTALGTLRSDPADQALGAFFDQLAAGDIAPEVQLDLLEAVETGASDSLKARVAAYRETLPSDAAYDDVLYGGQPDEGRRLFFAHPAAQCIRCHSAGRRGGDVGPNLANIASTLTREQLLASLVDPSARIAPGYGLVALTLEDGRQLNGTLREENATTLEIVTADSTVEQVAVEDVAERRDAPSSMPPMGSLLTRRELRDLVAFLATLE